jgi:UDP-4-amino-4-deoxy-L-arabinose formyltransferase/UDP-glucuronic acid dehydrogenase (UDP-4-keto-hexauronic acid decarboxylating)
MDEVDRLNVILLALTGFGNTVLEALLRDARANVEAVFTVKYDYPFPYYEERQLIELCRERGIVCYHGVSVCSNEGIELLCKHSPDLIIVATWKQILKENVLRLPTRGVVNFHPSLLPHYRGPCPTNAALHNDDQVTGMTIHYVTDRPDEGNILLQRSIVIGNTDNDGQLRQKLARLAGELVPELVGMFSASTKPAGTPQDHSLVTLAPKPTVEEGYLERAMDINTIRRKMRAFNPLPGTSILIGNRRVAVDRFERFQESRTDGIYDNGHSIDLVINSEAIRLYKKAD